MAQYFDMLREEDPNILSNGKPEAALYESGSVTNRLITDLPLITPKDDAEASLLQRSGYVQNQDGTYQTPIRDLAQGMQQRELLKREAREIEYNKTRNSTMFKIGDALADTGRLFMSPLFWLSGEDTSKYDPSERLKTGYRKQFSESLTHTEGLYGRVQQAQKTRQDYRNQLQVSDMSRLKQSFDMSTPISPHGKAILDYANRTGQVDAFNSKDPTQMARLRGEFEVEQGLSFRVGRDGRILQKPKYDALNKIGDRYTVQRKDIKDVYNNYRSLISALDSESGIGDVAAIFSFMKSLDPRSTVRDSEFSLAADAAGIFNRIMNLPTKGEEGDVLSETARIEMKKLAAQLMEHWVDADTATRKKAEDAVRYHSDYDEDVLHFLGDAPESPLDIEFIIED